MPGLLGGRLEAQGRKTVVKTEEFREGREVEFESTPKEMLFFVVGEQWPLFSDLWLSAVPIPCYLFSPIQS
jgi:hypothetical protein